MSKNDILGSGLINMGNTCFFNAAVQCLLHSVPFSQDLKSKKHSNSCSFDQWCVYCEMENTWAKTKSSKVHEPRQLVHNLKKLFKKFKLGRQEDSHEFLRYFVEGLQKSDIGSKQKNPQKVRILTQNSRIFSLFGGLMKSSVECQSCHYKSQIIEHFYDLSLQCQKSNSAGESLNNYFRIDHLTGNNKYHCSSCKKLVNANKRFLFNKLPKVLTIQFKRFTNTLHKLNKFVQYPEYLQLQKYCQVKTPVEYKLCGVVVHAGSTSFSGHYYSYNRVGNGWYKMDDSHVSKADKQTVLNQKGYLLFYERVKGHHQNEQKEEIKQVQALEKEKKQQTKRQPQRQQKKKTFFEEIGEAISKKQTTSESLPKNKKQEQKKVTLQKQVLVNRQIINKESVNTEVLNKEQEYLVKIDQNQQGKKRQSQVCSLKKETKQKDRTQTEREEQESLQVGKRRPFVGFRRKTSLQKLRNFTAQYYLKYVLDRMDGNREQ